MNTGSLATVSGRFALSGTTFTPTRRDEPSTVGRRPWGLRRAVLAEAGRPMPFWHYDDEQQLAVGATGPLIDLPGAAARTAKTTASTDGEEPPGSEDWIND